jgi:hypothetical protein
MIERMASSKETTIEMNTLIMIASSSVSKSDF